MRTMSSKKIPLESTLNYDQHIRAGTMLPVTGDKDYDYEKAMAHYESAIKLDPSRCLAYLQKASLLIGIKDYTAALQVCSDALKEVTRDEECRVRKFKGDLLRRHLKDFNRATFHYEIAMEIALQEQAAEQWGHLGYDFYEEGDTLAALWCYDQALELQPNNSELLTQKATVFASAKKEVQEAYISM